MTNVIPYLVLRQAIGLIAILMPLIVRIGAYYIDDIPLLSSISAYYYTSMREFFTGTLFLTGALLCCYRTPSKVDNAIAIIAGICAFGIAIFPTDPVHMSFILISNPSFLGYHIWFTAIFFNLCLYLVYYSFSNYGPIAPGAMKKMRNKTYKYCGYLMAFAILAIVVNVLMKTDVTIFYAETLLIWAFGTAWLVKGQMFFKDQ